MTAPLTREVSKTRKRPMRFNQQSTVQQVGIRQVDIQFIKY